MNSKYNNIVNREQSLAHYERLIQSNNFGFWEWGAQGSAFFLRGEFWLCLGYGEEIYRLTHLEQLRPYVHGDDWGLFHKSGKELARKGRSLTERIRFRRKDGSYLWMFLDGNILRNEDQSLKVISGIASDFSRQYEVEQKLKDSEERHLRILSASNDGLWEWDGERDDFHFSSRCWQMLGYEGHDDVFSNSTERLKSWRKLIHPEDLDYFNNSLEVHMTGRGAFDVEYRIKGNSGDWHWIRARGQAAFNESGQACRMSGTNMDVTDLKLAQERAFSAKDQAEQANKAKSQFLSSMSHELRTPLNAILGFTQLIERDAVLGGQQLQNLQEIESAGQHLLQLIGDVLDLSKVESGNVSLSMEPVLLRRTLDECARLIQSLQQEHQVGLTIELGLFESVYVNADAVRFRQTLLNLLSNGIKYNRPGGSVTVKVKQHNQLCRVEVIDDGLGIAPARFEEVFEPFNRLAAEGSSIEGTGVGLVITKQLVEAMGGNLGFSSVEGVGSVFWIDLPFVDGLEGSNTISVESPVYTVDQVSEFQFSELKQILYIEDNPSNIRLMEQIFEGFEGLQLTVRSEPFSGVYCARQTRPDLVITDINMPGLDGFEVLEVLKGDPSTRKIPVVALSANAMPQDMERGLRLGFESYLTKPLDINRLVSVLTDCLA